MFIYLAAAATQGGVPWWQVSQGTWILGTLNASHNKYWKHGYWKHGYWEQCFFSNKSKTTDMSYSRLSNPLWHSESHRINE